MAHHRIWPARIQRDAFLLTGVPSGCSARRCPDHVPTKREAYQRESETDYFRRAMPAPVSERTADFDRSNDEERRERERDVTTPANKM